MAAVRNAVAMQEAFVFGIGDLRGGQLESVDPDAVDRTFAILAGVGAHQKPGSGNLNQRWFES